MQPKVSTHLNCACLLPPFSANLEDDEAKGSVETDEVKTISRPWEALRQRRMVKKDHIDHDKCKKDFYIEIVWQTGHFVFTWFEV